MSNLEEVFLELREANTKYSIRLLELEKENARLDEENHKLAYSLSQSVPVESSLEQYDKIKELEKELQATKEKLEKATNLLRLQLYAISPSDITSTERLVKDFLSKNKQKDEVKE